MKRVREERNGDKDNQLENYSEGEVGCESGASNKSDRNPDDNGHRFGNFSNYYKFHPVSNRTKHLHGILQFIVGEWNNVNQLCQKLPFRFIDIGCNEGDLTIEIAKLLSDYLSKQVKSIEHQETDKSTAEKSCANVSCTGFDLDSELIGRAKIKAMQWSELSSTLRVTFHTLDALKDNLRQKCYDLQFANSSMQYCTDLTTLFSTTMWIHIHGGDDGLRQVLQQICTCTRFWIVLEPQPSKCYGAAAFRLRRLGLPSFDVSSERLRIRINIEEHIEKMLKDFNFERVDISSKVNNIDQKYFETTGKLIGCTNSKEEGTENRTQWNRTLRLYQRATSKSD
jgi:SAM-dependent methyltransferase